MNKIGILCLLSLMFVQSACAASFDCEKATTKVEKMICADSELSKLDEDLSAAYSKALKKSSDSSILKEQQRGWLKDRSKCLEKQCLLFSYKQRVAYLDGILSGQIKLLKESEKYQFEVSARQDNAEDYAVCRDVLASLKALNEPPMVCGQKFHPDFKQFTLPKWTALDPWENRDLILQILDDKFKRDERWLKTKSVAIQEDERRRNQEFKLGLKQEIERGRFTLAVATIRLHDGPRQVLSFSGQKCSGSNLMAPFGRRYFIVDIEKRLVDFNSTGQGNNWPLFHGYDNLADSHHNLLFLYSSVPYLATWDGASGLMHNTLFITSEVSTYTECFIEYNQDGRSLND